MAIVKCPECEGKVSTEAERCVHCGCGLTFCKECGAVFVGEKIECSECGNILKKVKPTYNNARYNNVRKAPKKDDDDCINVSEKDRGLPHVRKVIKKASDESGIKIYDIFLSIMPLVAVGLIICGILMLTLVDLWGEHFLTVYYLMLFVLVLGALSALATSVLFDLNVLFKTSKISAWAEEKGLNIGDLVEEFMGSEGKNVLSTDIYTRIAASTILLTRAMATDAAIKTLFIVTRVISLCISVIMHIFLWIFVILNMRLTALESLVDYSENYSYGITGFMGFDYWWLFIVAAIAFVAGFIFDKCAAYVRKRAMNAWFEKNHPKYYADYNNYVDGNLKF